MPSFSLAALTVLELAPPALVDVAAACGYEHVGIRLLPATPGGVAYPLMDDEASLKETLARLDATGIDYAVALTADHGGPDMPERNHQNSWAAAPRLGRALEDATASIEKDLPIGLEFGRVADQPRAVRNSIAEFVRKIVKRRSKAAA